MLKGRLQGVAAQIHVRLEQVREREEKRKNIAKGSANRMDQFLFIYLSISSPEDILTDFREKGEGRGEWWGERNIDVREKHPLIASHMP